MEFRLNISAFRAIKGKLRRVFPGRLQTPRPCRKNRTEAAGWNPRASTIFIRKSFIEGLAVLTGGK
ncbi:MAG: hypothetical protein LBP80_11930 [Treponema sp.]|nr:hypothetical protein [Treponema sp.]